MKQILLTTLMTISIWSCSQPKPSNPRLVGGPCEGCEAIFEYGDQVLNHIDTLPDFTEAGPKIKISGTVYENDGKTPARDVTLYIHHTNQEGYYVPEDGTRDWGRRHGYIRGWIKTDAAGRYEFFTLKPAPYPGRPDPMHIHYTVLEPNGKHYWIQDVIFKGDPRIKEYDPSKARGGNGLVQLVQEGSLLVGSRDVILGKNVNDYEK
ncbi:MAG: intradiol ring-cleavage dioxygenase [Marinoscillum sp.]